MTLPPIAYPRLSQVNMKGNHAEVLAKVLAGEVLEVDPLNTFADSPEGFTMSELQAEHENVAGVKFQRDTFRRKALATGQLLPVGVRKQTGGRPATVYIKVMS